MPATDAATTNDTLPSKKHSRRPFEKSGTASEQKAIPDSDFLSPFGRSELHFQALAVRIIDFRIVAGQPDEPVILGYRIRSRADDRIALQSVRSDIIIGEHHGSVSTLGPQSHVNVPFGHICRLTVQLGIGDIPCPDHDRGSERDGMVVVIRTGAERHA